MDRDREDAIEAMLIAPSMQTELSMACSQQNPKPPMSKPPNYASLLENDESFFDGILSGDHHGMQNTSSINSNHHHHQLAAKRPPPPQQFWNDVVVGGSVGNSAAKRFHGDLNSGGSSTGGGEVHDQEENNSFVSMLNQMPQSSPAPFHPNSLLGSLGDGVLRPQYQLPTMNWNS